jgi:para-nitrobenzyl esterase
MTARLLWVAFVVGAVCGQITEVQTEYGRVRGDYEPEYKLTGYYGIPFASPPIDELRFKPPVPPQPWNGTKKCDIDRFFHVSWQNNASICHSLCVVGLPTAPS